ncbi:MAG TPA: hypothetical protein VF272_03565 [Candidatus Saccharimonadia bacterium]
MKATNLLYAAGGGLVVLFITTYVLVLNSPASIEVPKPIKSQLNFDPILPSQKSFEIGSITYTLDASSFRYDKEAGILTYLLLVNQRKLTITQQAYPEILVYDKLVGAMHQYGEVPVKLGRVALTRPENLKGKQTAVLSTFNGSSGVLIFISPETDLAKDQWRQLFNNLRVHNE